MFHYSALILFSLLVSASGQECSSFTDCQSCIQSISNCQWCSEANFTSLRCSRAGSATTCEMIENPMGSTAIDRNDLLSDSVQMTPQEVSLRLRPGKREDIDVTIRPAAIFPLDVYFLMDFSNSMEDDLMTLQSLSSAIANDIGDITPNFTLGFGSFVDKPTAPYIDTRPDLINEPCRGCVGAYSFRHFLPLTNNASAFSVAVNERIISSNLDAPEGGTDGLLQAVVCDDIVGWRPDPARRLLVYLTDAGFHFGADGKIGGAVHPHDGQCHLNLADEGYHEYAQDSLRLDYPSVAMVNSVMLERGVSPVFLVTSRRQSLYRTLRSVLDNAVVGTLSSDSSNLVDALRKAYNELVSTIRLIADPIPGVSVEFSAKSCGRGITLPNGVCSNLEVGNEVTITAQITVTECTPELISGTSLTIRNSLFGQVKVNIEGICNCPCEMNVMENSTFCSNEGNLTCGLCICNEGRLGDTCECNAAGKVTDGDQGVLRCRLGRGNKECSGLGVAGECNCGVCTCFENVIPDIPGSKYFGEVCECNNFECGRDSRGLLCSDNGQCGCNRTCICNEGFSGDICECRPETECVNIRNNDELPCTDMEHGICDCGICRCNEGYIGDYCETCTTSETCGAEDCQRFEQCLSCFSVVDGSVRRSNEECLASCSSINATIAVEGISSQPNNTFGCIRMTSGEQCNDITYHVRPDPSGSFDIFVENTPRTVCQTPIPAWLIAVPIVVGLLVLGILAIIIAKLILFLLERYEYKQFKNEVAKSQFSQSNNPLYKSAHQEFNNPAYGGAY